MKVLVTTWNWVSHLDPMVALCRALQAAGHELVLAGQPGMAPVAGALGLAFSPVGSDLDVTERFRDFLLPPDATGPRPPPAGGPRTGGRGGPRALAVFADLAADMAPDLTALVKAQRPDVLIFETTCWAGWIAASAAGVPAYRIGYGVDLLRAVREHVAAAVAPLADRLGAPSADPYDAPLIDPCPPALQVGGDLSRLPVRYEPQHTGHGGPVPAGSGRRPRICVTWGTTMAKLGPACFLLPEVLRELAGIPGVELVAALTARQRAMAGPLPSAVVVAESAPLDAVLAGCDLLVAHGGAASMLTGCVHGLPQVLVPQLPDHAGHAARLAAAGAARVLPRAAVSDGRLRAVVLEQLADADATAAARALAAEIAAAPTPTAVASRVVADVAHRCSSAAPDHAHSVGRRYRNA